MLVNLMGAYMLRVVVAKGSLKSRTARIGVLICVLAVTAVTTAMAVLLTHHVSGGATARDLIASVNSISAVLWPTIAFLIVKVLMAEAGTMMSLTHSLPVTNRERQRAVGVLDGAATTLLTIVGLFSAIAAALVNFGVAAIDGVLTCIVMPALATCTALEIVHRVLDLLLHATPLRHARQPLLAVGIFIVVVAIWRAVPSLLIAITASPTVPPFTVWTLVFHDLDQRFGVWFTIPCLIGLVLASLAPTTLLPTSPLEVRTRFVRIPLVSVRAPHMLALLRSRYTLQALMLSAAIIALLATRTAGPSTVWGVEPLAIGGFFQYATLAPTVLSLEPLLSAGRFYSRLLGSLVVLVTPMIVVAVIVDLCTGQPLRNTGIALAAVLGSVLVTTTVGILFPARDDNPLSILLGCLVALTLGTLIVVGYGVLHLPLILAISLVVVCVGLLVAHGVMTISDQRKASR